VRPESNLEKTLRKTVFMHPKKTVWDAIQGLAVVIHELEK
jgi:hypothetical protein